MATVVERVEIVVAAVAGDEDRILSLFFSL